MAEDFNQLSENTGDLDPEVFRKYGYELIDWITDYLKYPGRYPVMSQVQPGDIKKQLPEKAPEFPESMATILQDIDKIIVPGITHWNHPGFFAYFGITGSCPGILGELLCAGFNVNGMLWKTSPSVAELEETVLNWLRDMLGLPEEFQGIIYDTASVSSFHAIAAAREALNLNIREKGMAGRPELPRLRVYASREAHSSIEKDVIALGIGQEGLRKIKTDSQYRMDPEELGKAIEEDLAQGWLPFCTVATIGTTSTTSIDPVGIIADICKKYNMWLHVDGAYGGSAAVIPEMRHLFDGWEKADSIVMNPHKWLFTPCDISVFYCKRFDILRQAFSLIPEYLRTPEDSKVRNYMDYGIQLGRRFRSLKLWMVIRTYGHKGLADRLRYHIHLAKKFASWIEGDENFELMAPVPFSTVCFRARPKNVNLPEKEIEPYLDKLNEKLMEFVNRTGKVYMSHTKLQNRFTIRLAIGNIRSTEEHVGLAWKLLKEHLATVEEK